MRLASCLLLLWMATPAVAQPAAPAPGVAAPPSPPVVAASEPEPVAKPLVKKPMFWLAIVGGVAIVAAGITLGLTLGNVTRDPTATIGVGVGN
jgi:hypothetical protein